ncbi:MAG: hypothetical protein MPW15_04070 [Candidatus Manganitrophus sp.]|nr:hypothetical protein [Candidatus Manganitrophus sp.]
MKRPRLFPGSPDFLKSLIGRLYEKSGKQEEALHFYEEVYRNTTDEMIRQKIKEKIDRIKSGAEDENTRH